MPGLNGSGPMGMGPMTGGARGLCNTGQRFFGRGGNRSGLGNGFGMGRGRGYRNRNTGFFGREGFAPVETGSYPLSYSKEQEVNFLKNQAADIKSELDAINIRISSLQSEGTASA
ncbi:DUF5320 domain-containing protein [Desulfobacterium sp. N47]|uniref:Uncharacterized protein n=1 Tax=uncultured Desulfobacterium sp. TaxID=201089 RepID=E1YHQ0_9BACT|nr:hypothetical protein N47_D29780 [uncultured Desulfobacterium sp.]